MDAIQIHASILFKLKKRIGNNMNLQHITILTLFIEGLLSFFSPCVLPILPVYIGILAGQGEEKQSGEIIWDRRKVFTNTFLFIFDGDHIESSIVYTQSQCSILFLGE